MVSTVKLPPREKVWPVGGRMALAFAAGQNQELKLLDTVSGQQTLLGKFSLSLLNGTTRLFVLDPATLAVATQGDQPAEGRFEVFSLRDGTRQFSTKFPFLVKPNEAKLKDAKLVRTHSQYLLFVQNASTTRESGTVNYSSPVIEGQSQPLWNGEVHAFDRATGNPLWPAPASLRQYVLWPSQAVELPVLVFVRAAQRTRNRQQQLSLLCIDKQTGRLVYQNNALNGHSHGLDVSSDPEKQQVRIRIPDQNGNGGYSQVALEFTDQPRPPQPPYQAGLQGAAESPLDKTKALGPLLRGFGRAIGGQDNPATPTPMDPQPIEAQPDLESESELESEPDFEAPANEAVPNLPLPQELPR
jgi:hypothetical protein